MATALVEKGERRPLFSCPRTGRGWVKEWTGEKPPRGEIKIFFLEGTVSRKVDMAGFRRECRYLPKVFLAMVVRPGENSQPWVQFGGSHGRNFRVLAVEAARGKYVRSLTFRCPDGSEYTIADSSPGSFPLRSALVHAESTL